MVIFRNLITGNVLKVTEQLTIDEMRKRTDIYQELDVEPAPDPVTTEVFLTVKETN